MTFFIIYIENNIKIARFKNCTKYFIPENKQDETLCNNIFKNGNKYKQLSYEIKLYKDAVSRAYRVSYKTQNAKK